MARARNPEQTRRSILDAASREFAALGFAGARTDAIAAAAGVNKRMLYHYFGDKAQLYAAVLTARLDADADATLSDSPDGALAGSLARRAAAARERPDDVRLAMWEALTEAPDVAVNSARSAAWRARVTSLAAAQRDGRIAGEFDAAQLELALTAVTLFPFAFRQIARAMTGQSPGEPAFDAAHAAFLSVLAARLAAVPAVPATDRPRDVAKVRVRLTATMISRDG